MNIDTNTIVSMTEANQNFSMVTRIVDQYGTAVIFKNNKPRYEVKVFDDAESDKIAADEDAVNFRVVFQNSDSLIQISDFH